MKKLALLLVATLMVLSACAAEGPPIVFTAMIESVADNAITVNTRDKVGFDKAAVSFDKALALDFTPEPGMTVEITILPEIRESYPVQVTATSIKLISKDPVLPDPTYIKITAQEAKTLMDAGGVVVVDVREPFEYEDGHIEGALLLPVGKISTDAPALLPDKDATILVYCRSGNRSVTASNALLDMGYTDVRDFGGILDWPYGTVKPE